MQLCNDTVLSRLQASVTILVRYSHFFKKEKIKFSDDADMQLIPICTHTSVYVCEVKFLGKALKLCLCIPNNATWCFCFVFFFFFLSRMHFSCKQRVIS